MRCELKLTADLPRSASIEYLPWISCLLLWSLWLYLNRLSLDWLTFIPQRFSAFHQLLLGSSVLILAFYGRQCWRQRDWRVTPELKGQPMCLLIITAIAIIALRWKLELEPLIGAFFVLGSYGGLGLFLPVKVWRQGLPLVGAIALLFLTALGPLPQSWIPELLAFILQPLPIHALSAENILVLDTGIAFIDLPCSGRRTLWVGSLFLILATVVERRQMGWRWLALYGLNLGLILSTNFLRILAVVILTYGLHQPAIAQMIHIPFGLFSLIAVCLISWGLLRLIPQHVGRNQSPPHLAPPNRWGKASWVVCLSILLGLTMIPLPAKAALITPSLNQWRDPLTTQTLTLTPVEQQFFQTYRGVVAQKQAFRVNQITGSMIVVSSPTWEAHHSPERCLTNIGYRVDHMAQQQLTPKITGRWLDLNGGQQNAAYWFQSANQTTDSYLDRLWRDVTHQDAHWSMVSMVFDQPVSSQDLAVQDLLQQVYGAIAPPAH